MSESTQPPRAPKWKPGERAATYARWSAATRTVSAGAGSVWSNLASMPRDTPVGDRKSPHAAVDPNQCGFALNRIIFSAVYPRPVTSRGSWRGYVLGMTLNCPHRRVIHEAGQPTCPDNQI